MIAIIRTGGKQYIVKPGDKLRIEKLDKKEGDEFLIPDVLLVEDGKNVEVGTPIVKKAVQVRVVGHGKEEKVIVFKYKAKKRESRKIGHRQPYTEIEILGIK